MKGVDRVFVEVREERMELTRRTDSTNNKRDAEPASSPQHLPEVHARRESEESDEDGASGEGRRVVVEDICAIAI